MKAGFRIHLYLFLVALIYGANYTIAKWVMDDAYIDPLGFIFYRVSAATLLFFIASIFIREKVDFKDHKWLFVGAVFGVWLNQSLFFYGLYLGSPIHASLLMTTTPILVLPASVILVGEKVTIRKVLGILIGFAGAIGLILNSGMGSMGDSSIIGDLMIFFNALSFALYLVLVKKLTSKYHPVTISKWIFLYGWFLCFPLGIKPALAVEWGSFTDEVWLSFAYVLVFTTFVAYLLNAFALRSASASLVSIYIYLQPLLAISIAIIMGASKLNITVALCGLIIFLGVYLVSFKRIRKNSLSI
jgi:drug/metabolite transporter (DMT)-like permease